MTSSKEDRVHAFAIVRLDLFHGDDVEMKDKVFVKEIVWSAEMAEREVARLNALQKDSGVLYFWRITRLAPRES